MAKYLLPVEAMQWTGDNEAELTAFLAEHQASISYQLVELDGTTTIAIEGKEDEVFLHVKGCGAWVVFLGQSLLGTEVEASHLQPVPPERVALAEQRRPSIWSIQAPEDAVVRKVFIQRFNNGYHVGVDTVHVYTDIAAEQLDANELHLLLCRLLNVDRIEGLPHA